MLLAAATASAQTSNHGRIEGRVSHAINGQFIRNARVAVEGTALEAFTNENGEYVLAGVPAGPALVIAQFPGMENASANVTVGAGGRATTNLALGTRRSANGDGPIMLAEVTVIERELNAQEKALQAQKLAPNVMNVVEFNEFANMGDGDASEVLKYVPGVAIYGERGVAAIRGLTGYTTAVTADGANLASAFSDRDFRLSDMAIGNLERIEVTKVPTPDMPATAIGGAINLVYKSGLNHTKPVFNYNIYATASALDGLGDIDFSLRKNAGKTYHTSTSSLQPGAEFSYIVPVSRTFAFTFNAQRTSRYQEGDFPQWARNYHTLIQTNHTISSSDVITTDTMASMTADWKPHAKHLLRFSLQSQRRELITSRTRLVVNYGAGATGDRSFTQGVVPGVGTLTQSDTMDAGRNRRGLHGIARYTFSDDYWTIVGSASYSRGKRGVIDVSGGTFATVGSTGPSQLVIRGAGLDEIDQRAIPTFTAVNRSGAPVDIYSLDSYLINNVTSNESGTTDVRDGAKLDFTRKLDTSMSLALKFGGAVDRQRNDQVANGKNWTFSPPGGTAGRMVSNLDVKASEYARRKVYTNSSGRQVIVENFDTAKVFDIYREHPEYFVLNEAAAYIAKVNGSSYLEETISAAYLRMDVKLLQNRLSLVGGVRYEHTSDNGQGSLDDISATFVRDAAGNIVRNAAGQPVRITTDALALAKLQYLERASQVSRSYDGYHPSLNSSYAILDNLIFRLGYARTIGRPRLAEILPGATIGTPDASQPVINVINTGLKPWTANSYDASLELYSLKGASLSAGVFRKKIQNFFAVSREDATPELLASYGISEEFAGYEIVSKRNAGEAIVNGFEWSYRQTFPFLSGWARGISLFVNGTQLKVTGANANDFDSFAPMQINYGISYATSRFLARINVADNRKGMRRSALLAADTATQGAGSYAAFVPLRLVDLSLEYRFSPRLTIYGSVRNLTAEAAGTTGRRGPGVPSWAEPLTHFTTGGSNITLGVRGEF